MKPKMFDTILIAVILAFAALFLIFDIANFVFGAGIPAPTFDWSDLALLYLVVARSYYTSFVE